MKKVIFLHGFFAAGSCIPASAMREALEGKARVISPDLPRHPKEAAGFVKSLCHRENPDLLVGNSCGAFVAQMLAPLVGVPALLGNPHLEMSEFLKVRKGPQRYKAPRQDGKQDFVIDDQLISEFAEVEKGQFDNCSDEYRDKVWGLFGEQDTLAHYKPLFLQHYTKAFHFPGGHTPTADEVRQYYVPLVERMLAML